ncbi:MAG: peptidyl-tRNA hydrolase, partial [Clostridia bacterium]|nr:peptidyl-tRNA hydrolase [Clostridia bacterium]
MYLIVGLGNPDKKYEKTFHNVGYIAVGDVADKLGVKFKKKECEASVAEAFVGGEKVIIARPVTYMNNSGRAVKQLMAKYKIAPDKLLILYDDYDLPKGK